MKVVPIPVEQHPSGRKVILEDDDINTGKTCIFLTGSIGGTLVTADQTAYDTTPEFIAVKPEHASELATLILKTHKAAGRYRDAPLPAE
jgi:hypothetical protein